MRDVKFDVEVSCIMDSYVKSGLRAAITVSWLNNVRK